MNFNTMVALLKETFNEWLQDDISRHAAALAYYTIFSMAPIVVIAIAIAGSIFGEEAARGEIVGQIQGLVGNEGAKFIETAIDHARRPDSNASTVASLVGIFILLFGASGVFAQLQDSLNMLWGVETKPGLWIRDLVSKRLFSFSIVLGTGFLLLVSLVLSAALAAMGSYLKDSFSALWQVLTFILSLGVIAMLFALMYKFLPDARIRWSDVWIGALITAVLFSFGKFLLGMYLGRGSFASTYGAAGSLVIILAWVYYSAQILFFGAEFTRVFAKRLGSGIVPDKHAVLRKPACLPEGNSEARQNAGG